MIRFLLLVVSIVMIHSSVVAQDNQDCDSAMEICSKSSMSLIPNGSNGEEDEGLEDLCVMGENHPAWFYWTIKEAGTLTFELTPESEQDLDFVVFLLDTDLNCETKQVIRCMASGLSIGQDSERCMGATGLVAGEIDTVEYAGCSLEDNNYLAPLETAVGETYLLLVNDFSRTLDSYTLEFGGTANIECVSALDEKSNPKAFPYTLIQESSSLTITLQDELKSLNIFDIAGQVVYSNIRLNEPLTTVDLSQWTQGIYNVVAQTGNQLYTKRFVYNP